MIDAGIATEDNLNMIKNNGYNYLCVSRKRLTDYELSEDRQSVTVYDSCKQAITLSEVRTPEDGDYYLQIHSPSKALTEASMNRQWRERFEEEMEKINESVRRKGGTKSYEKVIERVGRVKEKYPSIARFYDIEYVRNTERPKEMESVQWKLGDFSQMQSVEGVYFLRTNVRTFDEKTTRDYYNLIREIVRRVSTQKLVTTKAVNALGEKVEMRICSEPTKAAADIYDKLGYRQYPFRKIKICTTQT